MCWPIPCPSIRAVKAFAQEKLEASRFREANQHKMLVNDRVNKIWSLFSPTVILLTEVGLLLVWVFGIWQVSKNEITVGVLASFLAYISRFYTRLDSMSRIVSVTQKSAVGAKRIFEILDHVSSVPEPANPVHLEHVNGAIELCDIGFRYGNRAVMRGVSLSIKPGEMIGLVGHSGSGKSTLVNLICRFYDVSEGSDPARRRRYSFDTDFRIPPQYRPGVARAVRLLRHDCREYMLRQGGRHTRGNRRGQALSGR